MGLEDSSVEWSKESWLEATPVDLSIPDDLWEASDAYPGPSSPAGTETTNRVEAAAAFESASLVATPVGRSVSIGRPASPTESEWDQAVVRGGTVPVAGEGLPRASARAGRWPLEGARPFPTASSAARRARQAGTGDEGCRA